jgi:hypothetical protein
MAGHEMWSVTRPATERRVALIVVLVFVVAGSAWILLTDLLLYSVIQDRTVVARFETAKGWAFVALTIGAVLESIGDGVL